MQYFNLDNSASTSSSGRSKKIAAAFFLIGLIACLGAVLYFQNGSSQPQFITNIVYNNNGYTSQIINSSRAMTVCTNQFDQNNQSWRNVCTLFTSDQEIVVTRLTRTTLQVYIVYKNIEEKRTDNFSDQITVTDMKNDPINEYEGVMAEVDLIFKAVISSSGSLISLESPNGDQPDKLIRLTERLIEQTFPEIDVELYEYRGKGQIPLRSSNRRRVLQEMTPEEIEQLPIQETYLGDVAAEYNYKIDKEGNTILSKEYTDEDFVNYSYDLGGEMPDIKFNSVTVVDSEGLVSSNNEQMHFNITEPSATASNAQADEILGLISVTIESTMVVNHVRDEDEELLEGIRKYEEFNEFQVVNLDSDSGFIIIDNHEPSEKQEVGEKPLLGASAVFAYTKEISVFSKSVFGQSLDMKIIQDNYEIYSDVQAGIYWNNRKVVDVYSTRINHPWLACESSYSGSGTNFEKEYQIFSVQFPILGIITIPVRASITLIYGWSFNVAPQAELCNIVFQSYAKPSIKAEGGLSILGLAEGGVSARGSVANGYFNFNVSVNRSQFLATLDINAQLIPFEYTIDAYYRYFRCDLSSLWKRRMLFFKFIKKVVQKVVNVVTTVVQRVVNMCGMSQPRYINLAQGKIGGTQTLNIFKTVMPFKNRS